MFPLCKLPSFPMLPSKPKSLLLPRQTGKKGLGIRALSEPGGVSTGGGPQGYPQPYSVKSLLVIDMALSQVPNSKTVAGVRIGLAGDKFIVNPTTKEMEDSELDLLVAGTDNAMLMIEGYCDFLTEEKLLQAVEVGQVVTSFGMPYEQLAMR